MSNNLSEIEDIRKQLKTIEDAVKELREQDLLIAKKVAEALCTTDYNMDMRTFSGEELDSFIKLWKPKLAATKREIEHSQSLKKVLEIAFKFDEELGDYVRASKVDTADKAMEIAHSFIKKYVPVALPLKAERKDDEWLVDIDVGALAVKVAKVRVDARTGDILSYDIPEKK